MTEYALVMPFVTVASAGGPHDDNSYVAGFEMGVLTTVLSFAPDGTQWIRRTIRAENRAQADLLAMRFGYVLEVLGGADGWIEIGLSVAQQDDPEEMFGG